MCKLHCKLTMLCFSLAAVITRVANTASPRRALSASSRCNQIVSPPQPRPRSTQVAWRHQPPPVAVRSGVRRRLRRPPSSIRTTAWGTRYECILIWHVCTFFWQCCNDIVVSSYLYIGVIALRFEIHVFILHSGWLTFRTSVHDMCSNAHARSWSLVSFDYINS